MHSAEGPAPEAKRREKKHERNESEQSHFLRRGEDRKHNGDDSQ